MIATLRVAREVGKDGEEVIPEIAFTSGLTRRVDFDISRLTSYAICIAIPSRSSA
jgi:hypothetical protein